MENAGKYGKNWLKFFYVDQKSRKGCRDARKLLIENIKGEYWSKKFNIWSLKANQSELKAKFNKYLYNYCRQNTEKPKHN